MRSAFCFPPSSFTISKGIRCRIPFATTKSTNHTKSSPRKNTKLPKIFNCGRTLANAVFFRNAATRHRFGRRDMSRRAKGPSCQRKNINWLSRARRPDNQNPPGCVNSEDGPRHIPSPARAAEFLTAKHKNDTKTICRKINGIYIFDGSWVAQATGLCRTATRRPEWRDASF